MLSRAPKQASVDDPPGGAGGRLDSDKGSEQVAPGKNTPLEGLGAQIASSRMGVRSRLHLSFLGISLFVVIAAAVAIYSFAKVQGELDKITRQNVPVVLSALELSRQVESIVAAAPNLLEATTAEEQQALSANLENDIERLNGRLGELRSYDIDAKAVASIERAVRQLSETVSALDRVLTARLAIKQAKVQLVRKVQDASAEIIVIINPWSSKVAATISDLKTSLADPELFRQETGRAPRRLSPMVGEARDAGPAPLRRFMVR